MSMIEYENDERYMEIRDFEEDAKWFLARAWRGVLLVVVALTFVLFMFNCFAELFSQGRSFDIFGRHVYFQPVGYRVVFSAYWMVPFILLGLLIVVNRIAAFVFIGKVGRLERKRVVFSLFVLSGEFISLLAVKYSGGVESPMYLYFLGHIVALSSVVSPRRLALHIAFISIAFFFVAMSEYSGLIVHTDLTSPPMLLYRSPVYVYIITCGVIGYMMYIGVSSTNIFRKFAERKGALRRAVESKKEADFYLDLMGHDLTNYNQTILGNLGLLHRKTEIGDSQKKYVDAITRQFKKSERLISNVKAFSQIIDAEKLDRGSYNLSAGIGSAVKSVKSGYPDREITIEFDDSQRKYAAAGNILDSVLVNLIGNSVKHSLSDGAHLKIAVDDSSDDPDFWEVRIEDDGPGIPDEMKKQIFERYFSSGEKGGTGLGLTLVKTVVKKYGGRVEVRDRVAGSPGEGSVFFFTIPKFGG